MKLKTLIAASVLPLAGCVPTPPTAQEVAAVGYGKLPNDWQAAVKAWFFNYLKDPLSAQYQLEPPSPGYVHTAPVEGMKLLVGYEVLAQVNAKNSLGAYTGFQPYLFLFRDNRILYVWAPDKALPEQILSSYFRGPDSTNL
jgi:hypothetical protein